MKIRIYTPDKDKEKIISIPTGLLFSKAGMVLMAKAVSRQARKDYEKKLDDLWKSQHDLDVDDLISLEEVQRAESLEPPMTEAQARELFAALRDSKYLMHGLPLLSIDHADGVRLRVDL